MQCGRHSVVTFQAGWEEHMTGTQMGQWLPETFPLLEMFQAGTR